MGIMTIRRMAKKMLVPGVLVIILAMVVVLFYGIPGFRNETYAYKGPSVKIYGKTVKDSDFNKYLSRAVQQASQFIQIRTFNEAELREAAIRTAVETVAFERELKEAGSQIKVGKAELDKVLKKYFPTEEELNSFIQQQGFSGKKELRETLAKELEYQKFVQNKARELGITVPEEEVLGYVEEIHVSHILVATKEGDQVIRSDAEALKRANEIFQKLTNNGDISQLAKEYSDDPGSKDNAGSLGSMPVEYFKSQMVKEFADAALSLKEGEISKPVKSQFGYHVIKLNSRTIPTSKEYEEKYREVENQLLYQKAVYDSTYRQWLQDIYQKAEENMEIIDPALRAYRLMKQEKWQEASEAYQKALRKKYYKNKADVYVNAATVYLKLNQAVQAIEMLNKAPELVKNNLEFQITLGNAYRENNEPEKAKELLLEYGERHQDDSSVHQRLKEVFSDWKMDDAVAKEEQTLADIQKKEEEALQRYQKELESRNQSN